MNQFYYNECFDNKKRQLWYEGIESAYLKNQKKWMLWKYRSKTNAKLRHFADQTMYTLRLWYLTTIPFLSGRVVETRSES